MSWEASNCTKFEIVLVMITRTSLLHAKILNHRNSCEGTTFTSYIPYRARRDITALKDYFPEQLNPVSIPFPSCNYTTIIIRQFQLVNKG